MTYTIAAVKTVEQYLFDSKRPYQGFFSTTGDLRPPRGLLGSRLKLSSDPIIQLAEVVTDWKVMKAGTPVEAVPGVGPTGPRDQTDQHCFN